MRRIISTTSFSAIAVVLAIVSFQNCSAPSSLIANSLVNTSIDGQHGSEDQSKELILTVQQNKLCYEVYDTNAIKSVYKKKSSSSGPVLGISQASEVQLTSKSLYYGLRSRANGTLVQCHKFDQTAEGRVPEIEKSKMSLKFSNFSDFDHSRYTIDIIQDDCKSGVVVASTGALSSNDPVRAPEPNPIILFDKSVSNYIMTTRLIAADEAMALSKSECVKDGDYESPECACDERHDPLVIDLSGQGLKLSSLNDNGPIFDIQGIGQQSRVGWTAAGSEMAFVVQDLNKDGLITGGQEMFGDATKIPNGLTAANGFEALYAFDDNKDLLIDAKDTIYKNLKLWTDRDHDGDTGPGELIPLSDRVKAIKLKYKVVDREVSSNKIYAESTAILNDSREVLAADVWFESEIYQADQH